MITQLQCEQELHVDPCNRCTNMSCWYKDFITGVLALLHELSDALETVPELYHSTP